MEHKAKEYALETHAGQLYGSHPYSFHLEAVVAIAKKLNLSDEIIAGCWLHDTMEDCEVSFHDIKSRFGDSIAEIVYCVTDELGRNRKERKQKTYPKIAGNEDAICVKLCDRIANLNQTIVDKNSRLLSVYLSEEEEFKAKLFKKDHSADTLLLWADLRRLVNDGKAMI
jgi:guanosine-3',5'-bis(diphosphate) 3'-pyrophosphohydrolase